MNEYILRLNFVCSILAPTSSNVSVSTELPQTLSSAELGVCGTSKSMYKWAMLCRAHADQLLAASWAQWQEGVPRIMYGLIENIYVCCYGCPQSQKVPGVMGLLMNACRSCPLWLSLSQTLLPNFLKAHTIIFASTVSPLLYSSPAPSCFCPLTCYWKDHAQRLPNCLHNGFALLCVRCLGSIKCWCSPRLCP